MENIALMLLGRTKVFEMVANVTYTWACFLGQELKANEKNNMESSS